MRDLREHRAPTSEEDFAAFETDVLTGFVLARSSAGLTDSTIRNDANHLELIRDWVGRPLWEIQPEDGDVYFGKVLRDAKPSWGVRESGCRLWPAVIHSVYDARPYWLISPSTTRRRSRRT
ncbi:hypothetical protein [Nonomuraea sp. NPDC049784]|uniref:hypothetical protein n=1 Tax=Nonomuraea sp. NPDC049784 TaxID=3154361 RepID=UPI0033F12921